MIEDERRIQQAIDMCSVANNFSDTLTNDVRRAYIIGALDTMLNYGHIDYRAYDIMLLTINNFKFE